jgi:GNAT superfamily N-acetyltransferase
MTDDEVRLATRADAAAMAAGLADAFGDDPVFRWFSGQDDCEQRMRPFWRAVVRESVRPADHLCFAWRDGDGSAVWRGVNRWKVAFPEVVRSTPGMVAALRLRVPVALRYLSTMEKAHPTEPHYYLEFIGTRRARQGQGGGTKLLAPMLARCDDEGVGAYLESSNPRNVPFYARHGFVERDRIIGAPGAPPVTPMWRTPR